MKNFAKFIAIYLLLGLMIFASGCGQKVQTAQTENVPAPTVPVISTPTPEPSPSLPKIPNLQTELTDNRNKTTTSPIGKFDFKNFSYPLPHGWQDVDSKEVVLENGKRPMSEEEKKIGLSYITTKFLDTNGDGQDEAFVILKVDTGGAAIPQLVYVFTWKNEQPELLWYFRTGDRADGGLKDIRVENGEVNIELYGQDRYIVGELDTAKVTGDEEQLCCPTYFTRSRYKWNGNVFRLEGKRLTFSVADKNAPPIENMVEVVEKQNSGKK